MARADRRSVYARAHGCSRRRRRRSRAPVDPYDALFFSRLRNRAKWVFVFLAITFTASFVLFGVGTGFGGLQDILLQNNGVAGGPSESDARERIAANPKDAQAYRDLATALQNQQKSEESIAPLAKYVELEPSRHRLPARARGALPAAGRPVPHAGPARAARPPERRPRRRLRAVVRVEDRQRPRGRPDHRRALEPPQRGAQRGLHEDDGRPHERRGGLQGRRRGPAERLGDPVRARPDRRDGERPADRDRRLQALPRAGPRGPVGPRGQGADRAARSSAWRRRRRGRLRAS